MGYGMFYSEDDRELHEQYLKEQKMNKENTQINEDAEKLFLEAKAQFQPFNKIALIPENNVSSDLPEFTEEENADRVLKAMERLYGEENVIHDVLGADPQIKPTGPSKTPKKKKRK